MKTTRRTFEKRTTFEELKRKQYRMRRKAEKKRLKVEQANYIGEGVENA